VGLLCGSVGQQCANVYHAISVFHVFLAAGALLLARMRTKSKSKAVQGGIEVTYLLYLVAGFLLVMSAALWVLV